MAEAELKRLLTEAIADPSREPAFLRALLASRLFALVPLADDAGRLRLITFVNADGLTVIPVFTEADQAYRSAGNAAQVIRVPGRELFEATRGGTLLLDPNETCTTLYPEEIRALLDEDEVAVAPVRAHADAVLTPAEAADHWIASLVASAVADIPEACAVHLAQAHPPGDIALVKALVVIVGVPDALAERVARALAVAIKTSARQPRMALDLLTYDPAAERPDWLADPGLEALWLRNESQSARPH